MEVMDATVLTVLFFAFLLTSIPIGIAIGLAVVTFTLLFPVGSLTFIPQNMYSALNSFPLMAVPFFMLTGSVMESGGLSKRLIRVASLLVGNLPGGLAIVTVLACMFFGAISGSAPATVAAIGGIMVPAMVRQNYDRDFSSALIASAGGLGIIIPPSIPLVIYGVCTTTSIGDLFLAGIVPGIIMGLMLMAVSYWTGRRRGYTGTGEAFTWPKLWTATKEAFWALMVPVIILGGIYGGIFTPTEAAIVAVVYGIVVGLFIYKELTYKALGIIFVENASLVGTVFLIFSIAASLGFIVSVVQLPERISDAIRAFTDNKVVILLIINFFLLLVGMLMDTMSANLVFSPLLLAIVLPFGVDPVHFGIIVTLNLALGFVTPPMAQNIFITSTLFGVPFTQIVREIWKFIAAMIVVLFLVTYIPQLSLFLVEAVR